MRWDILQSDDWQSQSGSRIPYATLSRDGAFEITCAALGNRGMNLAAGGKDGSIRIWDLSNGSLIKTLKAHGVGDEYCWLEYSVSGRYLMVFPQFLPRYWDTNKAYEEVHIDDTRGISGISMAPNDKTVLLASFDGVIWGASFSEVERATFPTEGLRLAFKEKLEHELRTRVDQFDEREYFREKKFEDVAFSPNSKTSVTVGDGVLSLWTADLDRQISSIDCEGGKCVFSQDGRSVVVAGYFSVSVFDRKLKKRRLSFDYDSSAIRSIAVTKKFIVLGAEQGISVWNIRNGNRLYDVSTDGAVDEVLISESTGGIVSRHEDGTIRLWPSPDSWPTE